MGKRKSVMPRYVLEFMVVLLGGLASFSLYFMLNQAVSDLLGMFGIINLYLQNSIIIIVIVLVFVVMGLSAKKIMRRIA